MSEDVSTSTRDRFLDLLEDDNRMLFSPSASIKDLLAGLKSLTSLRKNQEPTAALVCLSR